MTSRIHNAFDTSTLTVRKLSNMQKQH